MWIPPHDGLDDTRDFNRLARIKDSGLTVMRMGNADAQFEAKDREEKSQASSHVVISYWGVSTVRPTSVEDPGIVKIAVTAHLFDGAELLAGFQ